MKIQNITPNYQKNYNNRQNVKKLNTTPSFNAKMPKMDFDPIAVSAFATIIGVPLLYAYIVKKVSDKHREEDQHRQELLMNSDYFVNSYNV